MRRAREAGMSRFWGGLHWRIDVDAGLGIGQKVGDVVVQHAKPDGAERQ